MDFQDIMTHGLHRLRALSLEQWYWIASIAAAVIAAIAFFRKRPPVPPAPSSTTNNIGAGSVVQQGDYNTVHYGASPQQVEEIVDQKVNRIVSQIVSQIVDKLSENQRQQLPAIGAENQALKRPAEELTRQAVTTVLDANRGAGQPVKQEQLIAQLGAGDVSEAVNILRGLEQRDRAHAAQRAREQGVLLLGRDTEGAYRAFERAHEYDPQDLPTLGWLVKLAQIRGSLDDAQRWATAAYEITQEKAARDPDNSDWQRDLSVSYNKVAGLLEAQGERKQAQDHYQKSLAIREELAARDPNNSDWQRDLSVSYEKVAGILEARGEREQAQDHYQKSLDIREKLAARDPNNSDWQRDLSISYERVAGILEARGERKQAQDHYQKSLAIREKLAARDPNNSDWQRDLSVSYDKVAGILEARGERKQAQDHYQKSLAISEKLAARDPGNAQWQADLAVPYVKLAGMEQGGVRQAAWLDKALAVLKALEAKDALTDDQKDWIPLIEDAKKAAITGAARKQTHDK